MQEDAILRSLCLELGRYGACPIALYHEYPVEDLLLWRRGLDHLQATEDTRLVQATALSAGNLDKAASRSISEGIDRNFVRPEIVQPKRQRGQSPF